MTTPSPESHDDQEQEEIEQKLLEALESPAIPVDENFWTELRRTAHARAKAASPPAKTSRNQ